MKKTMSRKKQQRLLHALCAGTLFASSVGTVLPAQAATITESQTYTKGADTTLDNTYVLTDPGYIVYNVSSGTSGSSTLTLTGDITITNTGKTSNSYALASQPSWDSGSGSFRTLAINPSGNATVKIVGNLAAKASGTTYGRITANFANKDSYLAGVPTTSLSTPLPIRNSWLASPLPSAMAQPGM